MGASPAGQIVNDLKSPLQIHLPRIPAPVLDWNAPKQSSGLLPTRDTGQPHETLIQLRRNDSRAISYVAASAVHFRPHRRGTASYRWI